MYSVLDEIAELGASRVRTDANWAWIEARQGSPRWEPLDALIHACEVRGLQVNLIVGTMPSWSRPSGTPTTYGPTTEDQRGAFAQYCLAIANRYHGRVAAWEVWNEANLQVFWSNPDPKAYTRLLSLAYRALKSQDSKALVLCTGTGGAGRLGDIPTLAWYKGLYAAGAKPFFDAANVHPYQSPRLAKLGMFVTSELATVEAVREVMIKEGDALKPMWGTEVGAPTDGPNSVSEALQATMLAVARSHWFDIEAGPLFVFTMRDGALPGASEKRNFYFGLSRYGGGRKTSYTELRNWLSPR